MVLPAIFKRKLLEIYQEAEEKGKWPQQLRYNMVSLVTKANEIQEGQLRPIGLLPFIYRIWMCLRKEHTREWKKNRFMDRNHKVQHRWHGNIELEMKSLKGTNK